MAWPAVRKVGSGLANLGNSCYINSCLQVLAAMPEFADAYASSAESIFRSADLFVFPSVSEGFALVLAEAMACGLPCLSYDCKVGPSEIIRDGVDGVLIPVGDEAAFSAAMLRLAEGEIERVRLASACKEILNRLSEDAVQPLWVKVLSHKR